jgi:phytoene synthase
MPASVRPAFATLWNLDLALADVVSTTSESELGAIRLAWWRERLEELHEGAASSPEPRLRAIQRQLLGHGITGHELSELEDAWLPLLQPFPWSAPQVEGLRLRGRILFGVGARLLGAKATEAENAGELWSLVDGALHCSDEQSRNFLLSEARATLARPSKKLPQRLRPLTVLSALAAADIIVRQSRGFARLTAALRHRFFGTLPRS